MPTLSQVESYIGRLYDTARFDCADLAALVQLELFGKVVRLPGRRQREKAPAASIQHYREELADRIQEADIRDGDVVVFRGETLHIGTLFHMGGSWRVLHNSQSLGYCAFHPLRDLPAFGLFIEGFYRWK